MIPTNCVLLSSLMFLCLSVCSLFATTNEPAPIRHRFLAMDEGRGILHYFDQQKPDRDWQLQLPKQIRDFQLIGKGRVLVAQVS